MPGRPRHRPQPEKDFFNELLDSVMDTVLDTVEPYIDKMAKEAVTNARRITSRQGQQAGYAPPPPPRGRQRAASASQPPPSPHTTTQAPITLYDVLEVSPRASTDTIEAAYKSLAKRFHPDRNKAPDADPKMKQINHAYSILKDSIQRKIYDKQVGF